MTKQFFPGFTAADKKKAESDRRAAEAAEARREAQQNFNQEVNKYVRHTPIIKSIWPGLQIMLLGNIVGFIVFCISWGILHSYDKDITTNGTKIGTQQHIPFAQAAKEYINPTYVATGGEFIYTETDKKIPHSSNNMFPIFGLFMGASIIGGLIRYGFAFKRNDQEIHEIARHMIYLRDNQNFCDATNSDTKLYKKHHRFIEKTSYNDPAFFIGLVDTKTLIDENRNPTLLYHIMMGHLKKFPLDYCKIMEKFDSDSIPTAIKEKYSHCH